MTTLEGVLSGNAKWCVVEDDAFRLLSTWGDQTFDVVVTDPPYDAITHKGARVVSTHKIAAKTGSFGVSFDSLAPEQMRELGTHLPRVAKRWALAFCALECLHLYQEGCTTKQWVRAAVWDRIVPGPQLSGDRPAQAVDGIAIMHRVGKKRWNGRGTAGIWRHMPEKGDLRPEHPTPKPESLMTEIISLFSDPGEVILDPFAGSGTTGIAALRLGRRVVLVEKDPNYADLCRQRLLAEEENTTMLAKNSGQMGLFGDR